MMKKGERLLCLAADCRKYQTQKEKVVPPESVLETSPETIMHDFGFTIETLKLEEHLDLPDEVSSWDFQIMHYFDFFLLGFLRRTQKNASFLETSFRSSSSKYNIRRRETTIGSRKC